MLAQNFKTAAELRISDVEFDALATVLRMLEREEIPAGKFSMQTVLHLCGTPACICGWANYISHGQAFPLNRSTQFGSADWDAMPTQLIDLFAVIGGHNHGDGAIANARFARPAQAAIALRNYLTHGEPRWAEALAS